MNLTVEYLRTRLEYDPDTGLFKWKPGSRGRYRRSAGTVIDGYVLIWFGGRRYSAHRLAWLYMHGEWPNGEIDHINCVRTDNRIANLRLATRSQNSQNTTRRSNNTSGVKGVCWLPKRKKWQAQICVNGRVLFLGRFANLDDAHAARREAATLYHGDYARETQSSG